MNFFSPFGKSWFVFFEKGGRGVEGFCEEHFVFFFFPFLFPSSVISPSFLAGGEQGATEREDERREAAGVTFFFSFFAPSSSLNLVIPVP